ncbi:ABC transporter ATP-binding protein [Rhodococcoides fascians]|uniref:ABC transporter ATP-binding protein n=1 Tax=Rhodococcoides fascians TaxID=1828 RepID=UPI00050C4DEF|nr:ATP-binding cassette domain-containing protein [Rhodococcus fascians]
MTALVEAREVNSGYTNVPVVRGLNLKVCAGEVVGLLGANGAGKTTTLLTLAGELRPTGGDVYWKGELCKSPLYARARSGLGYLTEERSVFSGLTTAENIKVGRCDVGAVLEIFPELEPRLKVKAGMLSGGEQQMLSLGRVLARKPDLLLADELSQGLAPLIVRRLLRAVREAADNGMGVLLVEQHVSQALEVADRAYLMRRGLIELSGKTADLRERLDDIQDVYLSKASP